MKAKLKSKWENMNKLQRLILSGVMLLLTLSSAWAIWYVTISGMTTFQISADEPLTIVSNFDALVPIDATNETTSASTILTFNNADGTLFNVEINATETKQDVDDNCDDFENDVNIVYRLDGDIINPPEIVNISSGQHELLLNATAKRFSCGQNVSVQIQIDAT